MADDESDRAGRSHYDWSGLMEKFEAVIRQHCIDQQQLAGDQLAPVDSYQCHQRTRAKAPRIGCQLSGNGAEPDA